MKLDTKEYESKMKKTIDALAQEFAGIRAGRANPVILDKVTVDYYGAPTQISQMAEVKVTDPRTITIVPWDASSAKNIERAILASDIGITPMNDGKSIRLSFPQPTEERRRELSKQIAKMGEEAKVALRHIRRDANEKSKAMEKKSEMTEDDLKASEKSMQDLTDKYIKEIDGVVAKKDKEIMEV